MSGPVASAPPCDCLPWNPDHELAPMCSLDAPGGEASPQADGRFTRTKCGEKATHMFVHRAAGRLCEHLVCEEHAKDPRGLRDHDAVPLATMFPKHFGEERPS